MKLMSWAEAKLGQYPKIASNQPNVSLHESLTVPMVKGTWNASFFLGQWRVRGYVP